MEEEKKDKLFGILLLTVWIVTTGGLLVAAIKALMSWNLIEVRALSITLGVIGVPAVYTLFIFSSESQIKNKMRITGIVLVALVGLAALAKEVMSVIEFALFFYFGVVIGLGILALLPLLKKTAKL